MISMYRGSVEERYYLQPNRCRLHDFDGDIWSGSFDMGLMKNKTGLMFMRRRNTLMSQQERMVDGNWSILIYPHSMQ